MIIEYKSADEIINQFKFKFKDYTFDNPTLYSIVSMGLNNFNSKLYKVTEEFIDIENGKGNLPLDFKKLISAYICDINHIQCNNKELFLLAINKTRKLNEINECNNKIDSCMLQCNVKPCEQHIEEKIYIGANSVGSIFYKKRYPVKITNNSIKNGKCTSDCYNLKNYNSDYEISIYNKKIIAENFDNAKLHFIYKAILLDDNGIPLIPIMQSDSLDKYLETLLFIEMAKFPDFLDKYGTYIKSFYQTSMMELVSYYNSVLSDLGMDILTKDNIDKQTIRNRRKISRIF